MKWIKRGKREGSEISRKHIELWRYSMKKMIAVMMVLLGLLILSSMIGCADGIMRRGKEAARNLSRLNELKIGMTKNEVVTLMGQPSKTEAYEIQGKNLEFWLYLTKYERPYSAPNPEYTPLAFEGDILIGWGMDYYDQALKSKMKQK